MSESTDCKNFLDKCTLKLKQVSSVPVSKTLQEWSRISEKSLSDGYVKTEKVEHTCTCELINPGI